MSSKPKSTANAEADNSAVTNFLEGEGNLDKLWSQFDSNNDGVIDGKEFNNLVYTSLKFFCQQRNPEMPPPTQDSMRPFIKKLVAQLQPFVDKDKDMKITLEEFKGYGTYLTTEFKKLQEELKANK